MKKLFVLLSALLLSASLLWGQKTIYIIDNESVENFDGSQLIGKTIRDYRVTTNGKGRNAITVHAITTASGPLAGVYFPDSTNKGLSSVTPRKYVYVIDGEKTEDVNALRSLPADKIKSISVLKPDDALEKYDTPLPVIVVTTKNDREELLELLGTEKIPGLKIEEDGSITVGGNPVKKITVNGNTYHLK